MSGYSAKLVNGQEIYIPSWPVDVQLENLTLAGKYLGSESVITISELNLAAVVVAIMQAKEPKHCANLIKHFVCQVRIDGKKIEPNTINSMFEEDLALVGEMFAHVLHSQYADFFELGLVREPSLPS
jgi:hypothetical protein